MTLRTLRRLSTTQVAERLGISRVHVTRLAKSGVLKAERIGDSDNAPLAFNAAEVEALREKREAKS